MTTALTYVVFVGLIRLHVHYLFASAAGWVLSVSLSYILNKSFTFNCDTAVSMGEISKFVGGYVVQFLVASAIYALLIGGWGLKPTLAFFINLTVTSTVSFAYMRFVVFHPAIRRAALPA